MFGEISEEGFETIFAQKWGNGRFDELVLEAGKTSMAQEAQAETFI